MANGIEKDSTSPQATTDLQAISKPEETKAPNIIDGRLRIEALIQIIYEMDEGQHPPSLIEPVETNIRPNVREARFVPTHTEAGEGEEEDNEQNRRSKHSSARNRGTEVEPPVRYESPLTDEAPASRRVEDAKVATAITTLVTGPERLTQRISEDACELVDPLDDMEFTPLPQGTTIEAIADLFARKVELLEKDGTMEPNDDLRILVTGSGSGIDAGHILDRLAERHKDIYDRTTVEVSDRSEAQLAVARQSPVLARHQGVRQHIPTEAETTTTPSGDGSSGTRNHVAFKQRDIRELTFEEGEQPHLIIAANVVSALPVHTICEDNTLARPNKQGKMEPIFTKATHIREEMWATHIRGARPVVRADVTTGEVQTVPVDMFARPEYLHGLKDDFARKALAVHVLGRLTEAEDEPEEGVVDPHLLLAGEAIGDEPGEHFATWQDEDVRFLHDRFIKGAGDGLTLYEFYNLPVGVTHFMEGALNHKNRRPGMMLIVMDWLRNNPQKPLAIGKLGVRPTHHYGAIMQHTVEAWALKTLAREYGASVRATGGPEGAWGIQLIDTDTSASRVLKTQKAFNGAVAESNMRCMRQRQFRLEVTQKLKYAINMFDPGEQRDTYIERALERLYNELGDPTMGYTSPATRQDHNLLVDVAGYCNYCQQYLLGKRFAERALEIASHASIEGRRRLAEAQEGLGERREAIQTLKEASDISPHNPRVWSDLRELYRKEGQWGRFVQATMNYLNYERTLGSEETIALLLEMCEAQKAYMQLTADKAEPYKITRDELIIRGIGTRVLGEEYGPLRFTSTQRQGRILQLDEVERLRTYVMYSQALDAAQELIAARDLPHWHETERQLVDWIAALQEGRANARAMVPADFFPQPDLTHEARIRTFNGSLLVRDEDLEASQLIDDAGEPESVPNHCDHIRTIMKTNPPALPTLAQQGKLPDPQDIAPPQEAPPDPYIIGLYSKFEMGEGYDDDIVSSRARLFWEQAGQEDDITLRIEVVEALVGYRIEGKDVGLLPEGLQALIMHGGDYGDLQLQVSLLEESDDKRVTN